MKFRRVSQVGGIAAVALLLAGCSGGSTEAPADNATGEGVLTITSLPNLEGAFETVIEAFEAEYPDIDVQLTITDGQSQETVLRAQLPAGNAPDIFQLTPGNGNPLSVHQIANYALDISDLELNERIPEFMDEGTIVDGERKMVPSSTGMNGAIYNVTALSELGLEIPQTYSELLQLCTDARAAGRAAVALGAAASFTNLALPDQFAVALLYAENPDWAAERAAGETSFADSAWVDALDRVREMSEAGCFQDSPLGTQYEPALQMVSTGDALMIPGISSWIVSIERQAAEGTEFTFTALPSTDEPEANWLTAGPIGGHAIYSQAKNPVAAKLFFEFWYATDERIAEFALATNSVPALRTDAYTAPVAIQPGYDVLLDGRNYHNPDQDFPNPQTREALISGAQRLLSGEATAEQVAEEMDREYDSN